MLTTAGSSHVRLPHIQPHHSTQHKDGSYKCTGLLSLSLSTHCAQQCTNLLKCAPANRSCRTYWCCELAWAGSFHHTHVPSMGLRTTWSSLPCMCTPLKYRYQHFQIVRAAHSLYLQLSSSPQKVPIPHCPPPPGKCPCMQYCFLPPNVAQKPPFPPFPPHELLPATKTISSAASQEYETAHTQRPLATSPV